MKEVTATMKMRDRRLLEEKLRYVAMEDIQPDPEREQQMLEEIKANFLRQSAACDRAPKRSRRHEIGRRVLVVSAAAMLLVVMSYGIAVLMPESVSHARGFVRTAAIWVNNTLHLGYEFEEPLNNHIHQNSQEGIYDTLEEAAMNIPYPLLYLDNSNFELQSISIQLVATFNEICISYQNGPQEYYMTLTPAAENTLTSLNSNTRTITSWQEGKLECWESDSLNYALTYYAGMEIDIRGLNISFNDFLDLCQTLKPFN